MLAKRFTEAKQRLFQRLYDHLNPMQREAVFTVKGPLLILAGAGSGKTTVLVNRIGYMIRYGTAYTSDSVPEWVTEQEVSELEKAIDLPKDEIEELLKKYAVSPIPAWSILSITFTNKAAGEMKTRLENKIGEKASEIWAGTFHSICVRLLRRFGERIGYAPGFTIYDTDDQKKLMLNILRDNKIDDKMFPPKTVLNFISKAKDRLQTPEDTAKECKDFRQSKMAELYEQYQRYLKTSNAVDFDDIIMQTVRLLQTDSEALSYCQNRFRYVLVDEYQDTNHAQFVLTKLISEKHKNLMVVGDDDQSIYRFRGADIENILNFDKEMSDAKIIKLEQNYRSTKAILDTANAIIQNNTNRHGKNLWTEKPDGDLVTLKRYENQNDEAKAIVDTIVKLRNTEGRTLNDFAVLYRINALSNTLEGAFARSGIPYRILGGQRFYERKEIKDVLAYLCVINNPCDDIRLERIINEPKRKIGDTTILAVKELAHHYNETMFDIIANAQLYPALSKSQAKLKDFADLILGLREIANAESLDVLIDKTLDLSGYRDMLKSLSETEGETRLENVNELISNAVEFMANHEDDSLSAFLEEVALVADIDNYDPDAEAVVLMTVHSAKGLEFPVVFLPAMEDGVFPSQQSLYDEAELEEERRLAYVAVTRAKQKLYISHARERLLFGKTAYNVKSKFVGEIPDELLNQEKKTPISITQRSIEYPGFAVKKKPSLNPELMKKPQMQVNTAPKIAQIFSAGDNVLHPVFGEGVILSAKSVGPDTLYEIAFENVGTKKMMGTYAKIKKA